jgi:hypothetical protein
LAPTTKRGAQAPPTTPAPNGDTDTGDTDPGEDAGTGTAILYALTAHDVPITLEAKLAGVLADVRRIPKRGYNDAQKYAFAQEGDIADMVRWSLNRHRVAFGARITGVTRSEIKSRSGTTGTEVLVDVDFTLTCADTGQAETYPWQGEATDYQDKALPKALTAAKKTFLVMQFLVSTGEPEPDGAGEQFTRTGAAPAGRASGQAVQPPRDGYNADGTPDERLSTSAQRGRVYGLAKSSPFLASLVDGKVKVSEVAVHDLVAWCTRDDPGGPVTSLSDLTRWQIARIFKVIERTNDDAAQAGRVAAAVAEWVEANPRTAPSDPPFADTAAAATAEVDPDAPEPAPAGDTEPADDGDGYPG